MASSNLRRTRIVCISDTHNSTVKLPDGDVLIHAGDITNQGSYSELSKAVKWLESTNFEAKIVIAGNHDITLDEDFYAQHGLYFHNKNPQASSACVSLLQSSPSITYLNHEAATVRLRSPTGPHTQFTVFGSPYSPRHGFWAFYYDAPVNPSIHDKLTPLWHAIPLETDIVVTHTPPRTHRDETDERHATGCEALRQALWRVRPRLAVCGHIHDGRGVERVTWDLGCPNVAHAERGVVLWEDPGEGNNKISLVDLTGRKAPSLANDGSHPGRPPTARAGPGRHQSRVSPPTAGRPSRPRSQIPPHTTPAVAEAVPEPSKQTASPITFDSDVVGAQGSSAGATSTIGLGGDPRSARCDQEALVGRTGRLETCVVNAAILKSRYPHIGGKTFNKPIVVDVDLPVWYE